MVCISIAMIRKLLPVCGTPKSSPAGVPLTSPRTMTRSPETRTSLMSNFMLSIPNMKFDINEVLVKLHDGDRLGDPTDDFDGGVRAAALAGHLPLVAV